MKPELIQLLEIELNISFYAIPYGDPTSKSKSYFVDDKDNLTELNIHNLNLNSIPQAFYSDCNDLKTIETLNLRSNNILSIGTFLNNMTNLSYLDLRNNKISDLTIFNDLKVNLKSVFLDDNNISDITPIYNKLKFDQIVGVTFANNPIVYPQRNIKNLSELLNAIGKQISFIEEIISKNILEKNDYLDLGNLGIRDLSWFPSLFMCVHLKVLIISNEWAEYNNIDNRWERKQSKNKGAKNFLYSLPIEFSNFKVIEKLIIGGDWKNTYDDETNNWRIKDISSIFKLEKLSYLNISNNQIEDVSGLVNLKRLEIIHLNNNKIINVPDLRKLLKLREVYLSNNQIENIDFLTSCTQLETVDLHSNKIVDLIPLKDLLKNSKTGISIKNSSWEKKVISISKNSSKIVPPYEILNHGNDSFFLYLKQLEYEETLKLEKYLNKEIKIILVGNSSSGKSTMLNYLKTKRFKASIPITQWLVTEELHNIVIDRDIFKLRFFDFGGQDYYHDTHKMFFSGDSVYLLLWDKKSNRLDEIDDDRNSSNESIQVFPLSYWLDSIKLYANKSLSESQKQIEQLLVEREIDNKSSDVNKENWENEILNIKDLTSENIVDKNILVVQNKIDLSQDYLNQFELTEKYSGIFDFANISLLKNKGKKNFEELYYQIIKNNPNYNRPLLATWGYVKDNLVNIFQDDDFIVSVETFKERINGYLSIWLKENFKKKDNEISKILFKDEEIILFANFLKEIGLVIFNLEQEELKDCIVVKQNIFLEKVYEILDVAKENQGKFHEDEMPNIEHIALVIKILISHQIIFKEKATSSYIFPLFLPVNPSFLIDLLADLQPPFRRFRFKGFIPKSIILSIYSEVIYKQNISEEDFYYWKNGLIFKDKKTLAS